MSTVVHTMECYPQRARFFGLVFGALVESMEPDHEACPGGHHIPGVLGGWHCPCPCHLKEAR